jgi:hypothetical protein
MRENAVKDMRVRSTIYPDLNGGVVLRVLPESDRPETQVRWDGDDKIAEWVFAKTEIEKEN